MTNDVNFVGYSKCEHHCNLATLKKSNIHRHSLEKGAAKPTALILIGLLSAFGLVIAGSGYLLGNLLGTKPDAATVPDTSNQTQTAAGTLKILGDTFSGYSTFRTPAFQNALKASGLNLQYADEFDQAKRAASLGHGQADILVTTLDQFLKQKPAGKVVGLIDWGGCGGAQYEAISAAQVADRFNSARETISGQAEGNDLCWGYTKRILGTSARHQV
jgi:hypothetical protein